MKGLSIKKLAAVAAGAALVGTALAPFAGALAKSDIYSANGAPKVKVVVGAESAVSDAVWAGNIASKIASMAYGSTDVTCSAGIGESACTVEGATATVDLTVGGTTTVSTDQQKLYKVALNSGSSQYEINGASLLKTDLPFLKDETVTIKVDNNTSSINEAEKIYVKADAQGYFSSSPYDVITTISSGNFYYQTTLNGSTGINLGTQSFTDSGGDDQVSIYLFGTKYYLSSATLSGTKEVRLVSGSQKDKYFSGDKIEGLKGDGEYDGQEVSIAVSNIVASGPAVTSYSATFDLIVNGEVIYSTDSLSTGQDLKDNVFDSEDNYAIKDSVYIDSIAVDAETGKGYVLVTVGANTLKLVNGREYPYDSTATSSGTKTWKAEIGSSGNYLQYLKIYNEDQYWTRGNNPLYPTTAGQSLTGQTGTAAEFGAGLDEGALGKGFAKVEFKGFDFAGKETTTVEVGSNAANGVDGLKYIGTDDTVRYVPFFTKVALQGADGKDQNKSFNSYSATTEKELFMTLNKGASADRSNRSDFNVTVLTADVVNGRAWTITNVMDAGAATMDTNVQINIAGVGKPRGALGDANLLVGDTFNVDGVTYTVRDANAARATASTIVSVDGYIAIGQSNYVGQSGGSSILDSTNTYQRLYFTEGSTVDANNTAPNAAGKIDLDVDSTRKVYYVPKVTTDYVYLLLDAQIFDEGESNVIQNSKKLFFDGTAVPANDGTYTEDAGIDYTYYSPKDNDFNTAAGTTTAAGVYTSSKAYHIAKFAFNSALSNDYNVNLFIDTYDGGLPGAHGGTAGETSPSFPTFDANYIGGSPADIVLTTGSQSGYYKQAYLDNGTKVILTDDDTVKITSPDSNASIQLVVYGSQLVETTSGGETKTGLAEGDNWTTTTGTEIKVGKVTASASCTATGGAASATPSVSTAIAPATVGNLVFLDSEGPSGTLIIVGGPLVNTYAKQVEDELSLNADGDVAYDKVASGDFVVAGFSADDTVAAAKAFIAALEDLQ